MATILTVSASPSATSRTARVRWLVDQRLAELGHTVRSLDVRDLPPAALLAPDITDDAIASAVDQFDRADGIVVATPVYKAAYSGLLKTLLDLLPQRALFGKVVFPLATGGTLAHMLAVDYALRPVLTAMGAAHVVQGYFVLDQFITADGDRMALPETREGLYRAVDGFSRAVETGAALAHAS